MAEKTIKKSKTETRKSRTDFYFDHKDIEGLKRFINQFGQIENRHRSSYNRGKPVLRACEQKRLSQAIKRARFLALLPFIDKNSDS